MKIKSRKTALYFLLWLFLFVPENPILAAEYFIDQNDNLASDQNPGTLDRPWKTITKANQILTAGDTVFIKAGTYNTYIAPANSGTSASRIIYTKFANDQVIVSNASYGILLDGKSFITVQGINFYNLDRFLWVRNAANYNIISYCNFDQGRNIGWSGSIIHKNSSFNKIDHCRFTKYGYYNADDIGSILDIGDEETQTDLTSHNLIENSVMYHGGHHVLGVYGKYNVIRNNYFHNEPWSLGTPESDRGPILYGNRNLSFAGYIENSGRNLFDGNRVAYSSDPPDNIGASGMGLTTSYNIVRSNQFYHNNRAGLSLSLTSSYVSDIVHNKIYQNTFFHNGINSEDPIDHMNSAIGFGLYSGDHIIKYNSIKNNLLYGHRIAFGSYKVNLSDQIFAGNWDGDTQGDPKFIKADKALGDPMDPSLPDLRLQSNSPCTGQGTYLTSVTSPGGSGVSFQVADAGYFMDGWGIPGVQGDEIRLFGTSLRARITNVNYETNTITVDRILTWSQGQGISLAYEGSAPDVGAFPVPSPAVSLPFINLLLLSAN
ncbi:MAG: right-handed parallel beta-helix repeat-containing protein [Thermodesulfobacteriota bacterium]